MDKITFTKFIINPKIFWSNFILLGIFILIGFGCSHYMELEGHYVTGMNNQIVWGLPHIFAVLLIVIASGVLNIASISSTFSFLRSSFATPPCIFNALIVATITKSIVLGSVFFLLSKSFLRISKSRGQLFKLAASLYS